MVSALKGRRKNTRKGVIVMKNCTSLIFSESELDTRIQFMLKLRNNEPYPSFSHNISTLLIN